MSLSVIPTVVFASWWNPTTWFNKWSFFHNQNIKVEQKLIEVPEKNLAASSTEADVSIVASSSSKIIPTPTPKKKKIIPVKKIKTDSTIVDVEINARAALKAKQILEAQIAKQKADEQAQKDALLKAQQDQNTILLQQQNDLLKQQLQVQQQIRNNTAKEVVVTPIVVPVEPAKMIITGHQSLSGKVCTSRNEGYISGVGLGVIEFKKTLEVIGVKELRGTIVEGADKVKNFGNAEPVGWERTTSLDYSKSNGEFIIKEMEIPTSMQGRYLFQADISETATKVKIRIDSITLRDGTVVEGLPIEFEPRVFGRCD